MRLPSSLRDSHPEAIGDWLPRQALLFAAIITATTLAAPSAIAGPEANPIDGSLLFLYSINGGEDPGGANAPPPGTTPWLKALITQAGAGAVNIALTTNLGNGGYAISWGFNMKKDTDFSSSAFTYICSSAGNDVCAGMNSNSYVWDPNNVNMQNNWKGFDMKLDLPNREARRLDDGTTLNIVVRRDGITPDDFNVPIAGDPINSEYSAVHVGGYGNGTRTYSTTLLDNPSNGTPAPAPLPVLGAVAAFKASRRLRRRLKPTAAAAPRSA